ncbi:MAG: hypothetical protein KDN18_18855 [Verrucomicrobiae bacterium]|nr:hypothetical protein [Verrucomicrobiae bacterium]
MLGNYIDRPREDSLTASVFSTLLHLPVNEFWQLLRKACPAADLPVYVGEPDSIEFWPKWDASGTANTNYVEPDVFIRFPEFDLIVEAKRGDIGSQHQSQWLNEVQSYCNVYGSEDREVRLMALGGVWNIRDESVPLPASVSNAETERRCPVHMAEWRRLLEAITDERRRQRGESPSGDGKARVRILTDAIHFFDVHGFVPLRLFSSFDFSHYALATDLGDAHERLQKVHSKLITR